MECGKMRELCTTFAANPQVSALPPHICQDHDVARFERRRHGPRRPVGATRKKVEASLRRSGGRESRYQPQSGIPPMGPDPVHVFGRAPAASPKTHRPGVRSLPRVRPREEGFQRRIGVFHKRGAWPAPREVSGVPLVGTRCRCPRTCIPDASSYGISPPLFCADEKIGLSKWGGRPPVQPPRPPRSPHGVT